MVHEDYSSLCDSQTCDGILDEDDFKPKPFPDQTKKKLKAKLRKLEDEEEEKSLASEPKTKGIQKRPKGYGITWQMEKRDMQNGVSQQRAKRQVKE